MAKIPYLLCIAMHEDGYPLSPCGESSQIVQPPPPPPEERSPNDARVHSNGQARMGGSGDHHKTCK